MNDQNPYQTPKVTFTSISRENKLPLYLGLYEDDVLIADMRKAADKEDYDMAIVFRDELIRRGKLQTTTL